jgi:hypothetical protein
MTDALSATVPRTVTDRSRYLAGSARRSLTLRTPAQLPVTSPVRISPTWNSVLQVMIDALCVASNETLTRVRAKPHVPLA